MPRRATSQETEGLARPVLRAIPHKAERRFNEVSSSNYLLMTRAISRTLLL
jgi:hypothetical protein